MRLIGFDSIVIIKHVKLNGEQKIERLTRHNSTLTALIMIMHVIVYAVAT